MSTEIETFPSETDDHQRAFLRSLESRAVKGTYFVVIAYGCAMAIRLLGNVILSRLFLPNLFGLMALMSTVIIGINLFSHVGVQDSIVQNPRGDDPAFLHTAWTIQVIRGVGIALISIPLAWPVARFYHEPQISKLLPVIAFTCLIAGFSSPSLLTLARHIGVARLSVLELSTQTFQLIATVIWAFFERSIWALVGGKVVGEVFRTVVSYWFVPGVRPRFMWEKESVRELVRFGRWILIGTALTFVAQQSDRLILAKLVSFKLLGLYGIAFTLSDIPRQVIMQFCSRVGFPFVSKFSDKPRAEFRQLVLKYRRPVLAIGGLMIVGVVLLGDKFILHVYSKPYRGAAWMIAILAIGLWHTMLYSTTNQAIMALQKAHYNALAYFVYCISLYIVLPLGFHLWGMVGAVIAVAASDVPVYFVIAYSARREGVGTLFQDAWLTVAFAGVLILALQCRASLGFGWPFPHLP